MKYLIGVDEAGRGPAIGSMFVAGYMIPEDQMIYLNGAPVIRDSKKLSPRQRETGVRILKQIPGHHIAVREATADVVDKRVRKQELNVLTIEMVHEILLELLVKAQPTDDVVVLLDSLSDDTKLYQQAYDDVITQYKNAQIRAYTQADSSFKVVGAASVIAKSERDHHVAELNAEMRVLGLGEFGSGYPADRRTVDFMKRNRDWSGLQNICRQSWPTWQRLVIGVEKNA